MSPRKVTPYHLKIVSRTDDTHRSPPIVALLIPAGDPSAFGQFFHRLPLSSGASYLVMEYRASSNGRNSSDKMQPLPEMLERTTLLPVKIPGQDTLLEKDCLYLIPAGSAVEIVGGRLILQRPPSAGGSERLLDQFLASVATGCNGHCIAVVLPDLASRVLTGFRVVRDEGGFTIVLDDQDRFSSPHPVYRSSLVDLFLPASRAASRLAGLIRHFQTAGQKERESPGGTSWLTQVYQQLFGRKGADYSRYGQYDVLRRVHRRMVVHDLPDPDAYSTLIQSDEDELTRLHEELGSVVSGFFIDPLLENALTGQMLPQLLRSGRRSAPLRVWIPHCPGGHVAFTIAMVIAEWFGEKQMNVPFQLFVTGFNNDAVADARKGIFAAEELEQLGRGRRRKYFIRTEKEWQIVRSIRESCIFATHDLLSDPPFSHIDLLIATGALIGLDAGVCARAFQLFHYALNPDGYLVAATQYGPVPPGELFFPLRGYPGSYGRGAVPVNYRVEAPGSAPPVSIEEQEADRLLLSGYVPASFLVDEQFRVIRYYGNTAAYLRATGDGSSRYLFRIVRDELVFELNDLIGLVDREGRAVTRHNIVLGDDTRDREVSLEMVPLRSFGSNWRLVIVREEAAEAGEAGEAAEPAVQPGEAGTGRAPSAKDLRIRALEKELQEMRGLLLVANEDSRRSLETLQHANEELQASNEEYRSLNRELKGFNEELTTIQEGLLARNRELGELNEGLRAHVRQLRTSSDAAVAIVAALRRPIAVLREDLRIHTANQAFYRYFGLSAEQAAGQYLYALGLQVFRRD
ncbi:MAG TPA: CheR family methyltransferase, partial [Puia sp.]|nr:CheR family methyltransferase [Puia sp.]